MVDEPAPQRRDGLAVAQAVLAQPQGVGVDGVHREGVAAGGVGDGGAAAGGDGDRVLVVARHVTAHEVGLLGLPEAVGGGGEEVVGEVVACEHGVPGLRLGLRVGQSGPAAGGALLAGGARVALQLGGDGGLVDGAEDREPAEDPPAQLGIEFGPAGHGAVGEPGGDGVGVGGDVDEVAYGDQAQAGAVAVLGAADEVAAQRGEGGQGGGPLLGREVAVGDLGGGEGEDALDDGEVGLARQMGTGGLQIGGGGQFAVADGVAQGVPDDRAGERLGQAGEAVPDGLEGFGVEADLGVGQVAVVEQQQGRALADGLRGGARDVEFEAFAQGEVALVVAEVLVVQADGDAVGAAADVLDGEGAGAVLAGGDGRGEGVDAGGAQPAVGPGVGVAFGGGGEGVDEVGEGGVGELVAGEVGVDAGEEVLLAEPGHQLAQRGGALGVGDAVEVELGRGGVVDGLGGDGVGGGALVGVVAPGLAGDAEVGPGVVEAGGFGADLVAHVLGEGLVQPDVVPPAQGDEVAEPHVGHLVGDDHGAGLALGVGDGGAVDELVAEGDEAWVLHGAGVELGDERLVVGVEGVGLVELLVVAVEAGARDLEELVGVRVEVGGERAAAVQAEGQAAVFGAHGVPGAGGEGDEVGGDQRRGGGLPAAVAEVFGDAVGEDGPALGSLDGHLEDGLEVGLVEGGEDALGVVHAQLGVEVRLAVDGVGEAVHALAGAGVAHGRLDAQFVLTGGEVLQGQPVLVQGLRVQGLSVQRDGAQLGRLDLDEGGRVRLALARGEPDDGAGVEGLVAGGQIEFDRVAVDVEELGTSLRFVAREYGHAGHAA
ncbi:putative Aminopeptidase N [Streptomyces viridochromogenes Tue57]|uniref:Putative Aminopeptidase N n=1 Tax=Streptomyces viridochromogenes Tue57 TaxID=1160705 RepID=L8P8J2_STRVR|nr:putative Aminopeptidase N [Streptomyces viridochromogenes Tue57]